MYKLYLLGETMTHLIIGFGVSACWAVKAIRKYVPDDKIIVITEESDLCYFKAFLTDYMLEECSLDDLLAPDKDSLGKNLTLMMAKKVEQLDIENKFVRLTTGEKISYDKVLIASGMCYPNQKDLEIDGVFSYSNVKDIDQIKSYIATGKKKLMVIGANFVSFEMIRGLKKLGHDVSLLTDEEYPCFCLWDKKTSDIVLEKILPKKDIITGAKLKRILSDNNKIVGIETEDGRTFCADMLGLCEPLKPAVDFMAYEKEQKIMVDDSMQTMYPDVYAAGDVTIVSNEPESLTMGWRRACLQGTVAGSNMAGQIKSYMVVPSISFQIENYPVVVMGYIDLLCKSDYKILSFSDEKEHIYKQLFLQDNVIMGAIFAGNIDNLFTIEEFIQTQEYFEPDGYGTLLKLIQFEANGSGKFIELFCPSCKSSMDFSEEDPEGKNFSCPICGIDLKLSVVVSDGLRKKVLFVNR